jgi:hypothetical protein
VIDLLVRILQCTLGGSQDEVNLIQVFKEAYEILYTYMIGKSRKNALYFAKYIDFFQTQFQQKVMIMNSSSSSSFYPPKLNSEYYWQGSDRIHCAC